MMTEPADKFDRIRKAIRDFGKYLKPEYGKGLGLSDPYRLFPPEADWPKSYDKVFKNEAGEHTPIRGGVYLLFDDTDELLYVGVAGSIGSRLGDYFKYGPDRCCDIVDHTKAGSSTIRIVRCDEPIWFLACALEMFLIRKLRPPRNKCHNDSEEDC